MQLKYVQFQEVVTTMTIEERFGQRIREIRHNQRISQEELAFRCNLSKNYISDVERGKRNITIKVIEKFALGLKVPMYELFLF